VKWRRCEGLRYARKIQKHDVKTRTLQKPPFGCAQDKKVQFLYTARSRRRSASAAFESHLCVRLPKDSTSGDNFVLHIPGKSELEIHGKQRRQERRDRHTYRRR
jgi:hypothetical protein